MYGWMDGRVDRRMHGRETPEYETFWTEGRGNLERNDIAILDRQINRYVGE